VPPTATPAAPALAASYSSNPPTSWDAGQTQLYTVTVTNTGSQTWNAGSSNPVHLGIHFGTSSDGIGDGWATDQRFTLAGDVPPGGSQTLTVAVVAPTTAGAYVLRARMVKEAVAWFSQIQKTTVAVAPPLPGVVPIQNNGFEAPPLGGSYQYNPTGAFWTFTASSANGGSGVTGNGSGFTGGSPNAPEGSQAAFLQQQGSFQQTVGPFQAGTSYVLSFAAAQRAGNGQDFQVTLDGAPLGTFKPSGTSYATYATLPFTATAGSHTLAFVGLDTAGGDNTAFIDAVRVAALIPNSGFEAPALGGGYQYTPSGAGWVFGANPSASGITGNGNPFTNGNPNAPEGSQVAFLQAAGSFQQSIGPLRAGTTYAIIFAAAQRGNCCAGNGSAQDFQVLLDGAPLGAFKPASTSYTYLTTSVFSATTGMHTLTFAGLDTAGGDNTAFIDDVRLMTYPAPVGAAGSLSWHPHQSVRFADRLDASVDLADGHVDVSTNDLSIPGRGPDLTLGHTWDSALAAAGVTGASGVGWQSSLTPSMGGPLQGTVVYTDSSGAVWPFVYTGPLGAKGPYTAYTVAPGRPWQLTTSTAGYTLTDFLTSEILAFDAQGRYLSDTDAYGNQNTMTQGANGPTKETNSGGRALAFTYSNGLLADAQSPLWQQGGSGTAGSQRVSYGYSNGQLSSLTWGAGTADATTATFGYSGARLTSVTTGAGRQWALAYDPAGHLVSVTSPVSGTAGQGGYTPSYTTAFTYGVTQTVVVEGYGTSAALTTTYTLDAQGEATATRDGLGDASYRAYDGDHNALATTDANGNKTTNVYQYIGPNGDVGLLTKATLPPIQAYSPLTGALITPTTTYRYDPSTYDLVETDQPAGGITRYSYDSHHAVVATAALTTTSPAPLWRGMIDQYDPYGERIATTDGRGVSVDQSGKATLNDPNGVYTSHSAYDAQGDATSNSTPPIATTLNGITTTAPITTSESYDGDGNRVSSVSANGATASYGYDHLGRQITTTGPSVKLYNGTTTTPVEATQYDGEGNAVRTTDALGAVTSSSYDPLGRQVSTTDPVSGTSITTYNATEQVSAQDPQGHVTTESYDAVGRLIQANDALTGTVQYGYDAAGNTLAITTGDTFGNVIQSEMRQYDALNRAITDTVAGPNGATPQTTTTRYDPDGNVYQVNQPTGTTTVDTYDLADQLLTSETDGAPVLSATHQNQTTYRYDAAGNQVETVDPDGRDTTTTYDGDSRTVSEVSTTPGVTGTTTMTTTSGYDPAGNTLAQTVRTRDPAGNVQTFTDAATFDAADNQTSTTDNGVTTQYGYDAAGQQRTQTYQNGVATATMTLDAQGRMTALGDGAGHTSSFGYNANDQTTAITLPNGVSAQASYDANGRLTAWHDPGPGQNVTYGYGYDAASRVTAFTAISGTDTLGYDPQNRLTSDCGPQVIAHSPDHCYHWTYDGANNITTATADAGTPITYTYTYNPQNNELTMLYAPAYANNTTYYAYDASGNTKAITSPVGGSLTAPGAINTHLGYNAAGRVNSITLKDGRTIGIMYNAQGQRASYSALSATGQTLYSAQFSYRDGSVLGQVSVMSATVGGSLSYTDSYLYYGEGGYYGGGGRPVEFARVQNGATSYYWYEYDGRGNVVSVTDINGNVVDSYAYDQWGEEITDTSREAVPQRLRFGAMWYDAEMQVQWLWDASSNRYYDPELERYLQPDSPTGGSYVFATASRSSVSRLCSINLVDGAGIMALQRDRAGLRARRAGPRHERELRRGGTADPGHRRAYGLGAVRLRRRRQHLRQRHPDRDTAVQRPESGHHRLTTEDATLTFVLRSGRQRTFHVMVACLRVGTYWILSPRLLDLVSAQGQIPSRAVD